MEFKAPKIKVPKDEPFKNDKLNLERNVSNITTLLKKISSPIVFSINAPWGCGKTTFLEMLNANLQKEDCKTVFFSAWETDFVDDPLLAFLGEMNKELRDYIGEDGNKIEAWDKAKKAGMHIIRKGLPALIKLGTAGVIDAEKIIEDEASKLAEGIAKDLIDGYTKEKEEITKFKENLGKLVGDSKDGSKLYIFVDELDRCKPTYAISLLERIKHLLGIEGIVFILAMDKLQLSHSIKAVYGSEFEAVGYLRRFIDIEYSLPKQNLDGFIEHLYRSFGFNTFFDKRREYRDFEYDAQHLSNVFKLLATSKRLSLREIEQLFSKINLVLHSTKENIYLYPALLAFLLIAKEFHGDVYNEYIKESSTPEEVIKLLYSIIPEEYRYDSFECALIEGFLIAAKNNNHKSDIGNSLEVHKEILNDETKTEKKKHYSEKVIRISERPTESFRASVSLDSVVSRIEMLEDFHFMEQ